MDIIDRIALDLKLDKSYLARIASHSAFYYRDFKIKIRNCAHIKMYLMI